MELLSQGHGHGILAFGAAHLQHVFEFISFFVKRIGEQL